MSSSQVRAESENIENSWGCGISDDGDINFCVWVLQVDGLSVPPFSHHLDGDYSLRNYGLNAESWQSWLTRVVATKDPYLNCYVPDIQAKVSEAVSNMEQEVTFLVESGIAPSDYATQVNLSEFRASKERELISSQQRYQQALKQLGDIPRNVTPPELWNDDAAVGEKLRELWQRYQLIRDQSNIILWERLTTDSSARHLIETYNSVSWSDLEQYQSCLDALIFYVVEYPEPLEYLVPPISILISQPEWASETENLQMRTLRAVERLAQLST